MWFVRQEDFSDLKNFLSNRYTQSGERISLLTVLNIKFTESKLSDLDAFSVMSLLVAGNETAEVRSVAAYIVWMVRMHGTKRSSPEIVEWIGVRRTTCNTANTFLYDVGVYVQDSLMYGQLRVRHSTTALMNAGPRYSESLWETILLAPDAPPIVICVLDTRMCSRNNLQYHAARKSHST